MKWSKRGRSIKLWEKDTEQKDEIDKKHKMKQKRKKYKIMEK